MAGATKTETRDILSRPFPPEKVKQKRGQGTKTPEHREKIAASVKATKQARAVPPIIRFMRLTDVREPSECWEWKGSRDKDGYALFSDEHGKTVRGARWLYGRLRDPLGPGMVPDHLCSNTGCVNIAHLAEKSNKENIRSGRGLAAQNAAKTHCKNGHEFTDENTYLHQGRRHCRQCRRVSDLARYHAMKKVAA